jgi:adenosylmethionine-8-amino-7-oxononanoate aminotransferase
MTRDEIYQAFYHDEVARGFLHSHSYTGNPLACRAALATLDIFAQDDVIETNRVKAAQFTQAMQPLRDHPRVRHFRHLGMIWAFDVADAGPSFSQDFYQAALQRGLLLRPLGHTVYFMPPYAMGMEEMALLAQGALACLEG